MNNWQVAEALLTRTQRGLVHLGRGLMEPHSAVQARVNKYLSDAACAKAGKLVVKAGLMPKASPPGPSMMPVARDSVAQSTGSGGSAAAAALPVTIPVEAPAAPPKAPAPRKSQAALPKSAAEAPAPAPAAVDEQPKKQRRR